MTFDDVKLVTHRDCSDGSACAVLFIAAGGLPENIVFTSPSHTETDEIANNLFETWDGPIWFVDVSISDDAAQLLSRRTDVVLIDHHKTAIPLAKYKFCKIDKDNSACGSKLFLAFLKKQLGASAYTLAIKKYQDFVDNVDDMDRWRKNIPGSEVIFNLHGLLGQKLFIKRFLKNASMDTTDNEKYLIEIDREREKEYIRSKKEQVVVVQREHNQQKVRVGFVQAGGPYRSALGDSMCHDPELDVDLAVMVNGDYISLRSRNGKVDCSGVAQQNGGGGHPAAAGCDLSKIIGKDILSLAIENMKFE